MASLETRIAKLENPDGSGRCFHSDHLAEDIQAARLARIERRKRGEPDPEPAWINGPDLNENDCDHPLDRQLVRDINAARQRARERRSNNVWERGSEP